MKTETRKYEIRQSDFDDFDKTPNYYHLPSLIEYKGKKCVLGCGNSDSTHVLRFDKDHFAVLSSNFNLDYASLSIVSIDDMETTLTNDGKIAIVNDVFIDNVTENLDENRSHFFDLSETTQADILAQWIQ